MKLKLIIIASLLASCEMVPDEVSASGFTSRYDFLGANSLVASVLFFILLFSSLMKKNKKSNGT